MLRPPFPGMPRPGSLALIWSIVILTALPELVLQLSDRGLVGSPLWRSWAFQYGAFWPGLLENWRPNFAAQPGTMFFSYALLHINLSHFLGNILVVALLLLWLDPRGAREAMIVLAVYLGSVLGAAGGFALFYTGAGSMVGASGAAFGLAAASILWRWHQIRGAEPRRAALEGAVLGAGLILLNAMSGWLQSSPVASQAHLGGAFTGAVLAALMPLRRTSGA